MLWHIALNSVPVSVKDNCLVKCAIVIEIQKLRMVKVSKEGVGGMYFL